MFGVRLINIDCLLVLSPKTGWSLLFVLTNKIFLFYFAGIGQEGKSTVWTCWILVSYPSSVLGAKVESFIQKHLVSIITHHLLASLSSNKLALVYYSKHTGSSGCQAISRGFSLAEFGIEKWLDWANKQTSTTRLESAVFPLSIECHRTVPLGRLENPGEGRQADRHPSRCDTNTISGACCSSWILISMNFASARNDDDKRETFAFEWSHGLTIDRRVQRERGFVRAIQCTLGSRYLTSPIHVCPFVPFRRVRSNCVCQNGIKLISALACPKHPAFSAFTDWGLSKCTYKAAMECVGTLLPIEHKAKGIKNYCSRNKVEASTKQQQPPLCPCPMDA